MSFERYFYSYYEHKSNVRPNRECIVGFPFRKGAWCNSRLKTRVLNRVAKTDIRENLLSSDETQELREREDLRLSHPQRELVYEQPQATGFATRWSQFCTGELKKQALTDFPSQSTGIGVPNSNSRFSDSTVVRGADISIVQYLGIAADEPERIARHTKPRYSLPLADIGWDEAYCRKWCEENDLLSPIYTDSARGGCWFCHNQGVEQLRLLRRNYPHLWEILLKWDNDSPTTFHADGHTVHDFDKRFLYEDLNLVPTDRKFRWKMLTNKQGEMLDLLLR